MVTKPYLLASLLGMLIAIGSIGAADPDAETDSAVNPRGIGDPGQLIGISVPSSDAETASDEQPGTLIGPDARIQLIVTGRYDSGQRRDLTSRASYQVAPAGVVEVSPTGLVLPLGDGEASVRAEFEGHRTEARIRVERFDDPPRINFSNDVVPLFSKHGCNGGGCHGKSGGQNGFALSLLGFEPREDYAYLTKEARGRRVFPAAPERSLLLLKATGTLPHGGGTRMNVDSDDYRVLLRWVRQGMPFGQEDDPRIVSVTVLPDHRLMPRFARQQIKVVAAYTDGSERDVTTSAQYTTNNKDLASVSDSGVVETFGLPGDVAVMVRFQGQVGVFRGTVPLGAPVDRLPPRRNLIDRHVQEKLLVLGLPPSELADDSTFLRRVTLDIAGRLPTYEEALAFEADDAEDKRDALIDRLLASNDYADYFAQKWSAILRNKAEQNLARSGNYLFHGWIRESLRTNKPYDRFVREIVTASGDVNLNPPVNWHRHLEDINEQVEDLAQVFLGQRLQCAKCHHHPFEKWSQHDYWGLAAYFSTVGRKPGFNEGEQRVYSMRKIPTVRHPKTRETIWPTSLGGEPTEFTEDEEPRLALARWLSDPENPYFARSLVNRYWKHFFGRGIVDPEDDMRATNPPTHPELLDELARRFVEQRYDLKWLVRTICRSSTYQLSSAPNEHNGSDSQNYSRFFPRRMHAEVMLDAIDQLAGTTTDFNGLPNGIRAVQLPDHGAVNNFFLNTFGRPAAGSACECERIGEISMAQALHLVNSDEMHNKLSGQRVRQLLDAKDRDDRQRVVELYYRAFARRPTEEEIGRIVAHVRSFDEGDRQKAYEDVLWALLNTKEFMFNH